MANQSPVFEDHQVRNRGIPNILSDDIDQNQQLIHIPTADDTIPSHHAHETQFKAVGLSSIQRLKIAPEDNVSNDRTSQNNGVDLSGHVMHGYVSITPRNNTASGAGFQNNGYFRRQEDPPERTEASFRTSFTEIQIGYSVLLTVPAIFGVAVVGYLLKRLI